MMHSRMMSGLLVLLVAVGGCASSGGGGSDDASEYQKNLGRLLAGPLQEGMDKILPKHQIAVRRTEFTASTLYWEGEWMSREATAEEREEGVTDARQRLLVTGRRTGYDPSGAPLYRVTFVAENEVQTEATSSWHPAPAPAAFHDHWSTVGRDLELEVRAGVRRQ